MKKLILFLAICSSICMTSCKKDEKSMATPTPTVTTSSLIGKYASNDMDAQTRDTVYIYYDGTDYRMTCPDANTTPAQDTIGITINSENISIPTQYIYGTTVTINGNGSQVLSNQINFNWTTPTYTKSNIMYYKQ